MRRRDFVKAVAGSAVIWPLAARAQKADRLPTIGFLGTVTQSAWPIESFNKRLRELGWIEGRNITIEYRWAEGSSERITRFIAEFVQAKVDVIVTGGNAVSAAKQATSIIPIIFAVAVDPLGSGFVDSLARPGRNVTGLSLQSPELVGKRLELLRAILPGRRRLAVMANIGYTAAKHELAEVQATAGALGFEIVVLEIRRAEDIKPAFDNLKDQADVLYVADDALVASNTDRITTLALGARLPTLFGTRRGIQAGGLVSYGPSLPDLFRRAAELVDKILHGATPSDIPVEEPSKFELVINLRTAAVLGIEVPHNVLVLADEVIE
jgi:putative tryptophan/tyrosine transport system substrate-binding protein